MLVEDDNNLREIYEARLQAEGYEIVSAKDGEEALALAVKEKPDLIITDIMMPKISGFDMLDILRSTPETKNTKVIMMTALGQVEDKTRADKLGADRYLVKSQVTLEDVAKVAREVLEGASPAPPAAPAVDPPPSNPVPAPVDAPTPTDAPIAPTAPAPVAAPAATTPPATSSTNIPVVDAPASPANTTSSPVPSATNRSNDKVLENAVETLNDGVPAPVATTTAAAGRSILVTDANPVRDDKDDSPKPAPMHSKVISPINDISPENPSNKGIDSLLSHPDAAGMTPVPLSETPVQPVAGDMTAPPAQ